MSFHAVVLAAEEKNTPVRHPRRKNRGEAVILTAPEK